MHYRRIVCLLLGVWLGGGILMAWYGARSFRSAEAILAQPDPGFAAQTEPLGPGATRTVLRYAVAEQNRRLFRHWEIMQIGLAVGFFGYLLFGTLEGKFSLAVMLGMLALTVLQHLAISPELGLSGHPRFWPMHNLYLTVEALKLGLGAILGVAVMRRRRSGDPLNQFDVVDKADHRHVNW